MIFLTSYLGCQHQAREDCFSSQTRMYCTVTLSMRGLLRLPTVNLAPTLSTRWFFKAATLVYRAQHSARDDFFFQSRVLDASTEHEWIVFLPPKGMILPGRLPTVLLCLTAGWLVGSSLRINKQRNLIVSI